MLQQMLLPQPGMSDSAVKGVVKHTLLLMVQGGAIANINDGVIGVNADIHLAAATVLHPVHGDVDPVFVRYQGAVDPQRAKVTVSLGSISTHEVVHILPIDGEAEVHDIGVVEQHCCQVTGPLCCNICDVHQRLSIHIGHRHSSAKDGLQR